MNLNNKLKLGIIFSTFVALMYVVSSPVEATYGTGEVLGTVDDQEIHEVVDAGIADMTSEILTTFVALSGLVTTSVLIKKTK